MTKHQSSFYTKQLLQKICVEKVSWTKEAFFWPFSNVWVEISSSPVYTLTISIKQSLQHHLDQIPFWNGINKSGHQISRKIKRKIFVHFFVFWRLKYALIKICQSLYAANGNFLVPISPIFDEFRLEIYLLKLFYYIFYSLPKPSLW